MYKPNIYVSFCDGCHVEIDCPDKKKYKIVISEGDKILFTSFNWTKVTSYELTEDNYKFIDYKVEVFSDSGLIFSEKLSLNGKKVKINFDSSALGDTLAWLGHCDRFQKIHQCELYVNCKFKELFEPVYPNIRFTDAEPDCNRGDNTIIPGLKNKSCKDFFCFYLPCKCYYATYDLGFYSRIPYLKTIPLSEVACHMLGIPFEETKTKVFIEKEKKIHEKKYVCIAVQSTGQYKYWNNPTGWQEVCDYLKLIGYDVICIDKFDNYGFDGYVNSSPIGIINKTGDIPLQDRITDILNCDFFIGLGSGLSWLAWCLNKPVIMISGFSNPMTEFYSSYRVFNPNVCNSCWNDTKVQNHTQSGWSYCPRNKNFECSSEISSKMVISKIDLVIKTENL